MGAPGPIAPALYLLERLEAPVPQSVRAGAP